MKRNQRFAVIGIGKFGSAIAQKLSKRGAEVIAIDNNKIRINEIKDFVTYSVVLDSTDKEALISQSIEEMDAVIVTIGEDFQSLLLTSFTLKELNVKRIMVRAHGETQKKIMEKMGIDEIISPEDEVSDNVTESLLNPKVKFSVELPDEYKLLEVKAPNGVVNKSLKEIQLVRKYNLSLVTLLRHRGDSHHIVGVPNGETIIEKEDLLIVFGKHVEIDRFLQINEGL